MDIGGANNVTKHVDDFSRLLKIHATDEDVKTYLNEQMFRQQPEIFDSGIRNMTATEIIKAADGM